MEKDKEQTEEEINESHESQDVEDSKEDNKGEINSVNDFIFKNKIKGKIGTFSFKNGKVTQELEIYKTENKKFVKF